MEQEKQAIRGEYGYKEEEQKRAKKLIRKFEDNTSKIKVMRNKVQAMIDLDRDLDVTEVKKFIEYIRAKMLFEEQEQSDIVLLKQIIQMSPELMSEENLDIVVNEFLKSGSERNAKVFINECITTCYEAGAKFREIGNRLSVYRAEIDKKSEEIKHVREAERRNKLGVQISGIQSSEGVSSVSRNNGNRKLPPEEVEH